MGMQFGLAAVPYEHDGPLSAVFQDPAGDGEATQVGEADETK